MIYDKHLLEPIGRLILARRQTVAVAESVTSGLLQAAISCIPDASKFFQGGITAYNIAQKYLHLKVEPLHATETNAVSEKVAGQMALNVCKTFTSDWGLAVTGYSTPVPESGNKLYAYYAISFNGSLLINKRFIPQQSAPQNVQLEYVNQLLTKWKELVDEKF